MAFDLSGGQKEERMEQARITKYFPVARRGLAPSKTPGASKKLPGEGVKQQPVTGHPPRPRSSEVKRTAPLEVRQEQARATERRALLQV